VYPKVNGAWPFARGGGGEARRTLARMQRRALLKSAGVMLLAHCAGVRPARAAALPAEVAGIRLPRSALALKAAAYARASCPGFLFNHCMRTFLFGALKLQRGPLRYRADEAFVGAALHDLGLLPAFESPHASFEIDGADAAERWLHANGASAADADLIWHEIQMHDGPWALTRRAGAEAQLVALGAGIDVDGPDPDELGQREIAEVVAAFPRLGFKREFTALLVAHCERKPLSQRATWLEGLCRAHSGHAPPDTAVEDRIAAAAFAQ
jgi:hypothetical protein